MNGNLMSKVMGDKRDTYAYDAQDRLDGWMKSAQSLGSPDVDSFVNGVNRDVDSFVNGVNRDIDAVRNAIATQYNNGLAEGSANKIKRIKHTMYGKAGFDTLRTKTLMYENWKLINQFGKEPIRP